MGSLAWHGMGRGKTLSALWLARDLLADLRSKGVKAPKFMVILPKSATPTWKTECYKQTPDIFRDMVIYPYSQLHNAVKALKYLDVRMLIFDESHYLKSPETDRIEYLAEFLKEIHRINSFEGGRIITLSGTPMLNHAAELYTTWAISCAPNLIEAANRVMDNDRYEKWKKSFTNHETKVFTIGKKRPKDQQKKGLSHSWSGVANVDMYTKILTEFVHYVDPDTDNIPAKQEIPIDLGLADDKLLENANIEEPEAYMALVERLARAKTPYMIQWVHDYIHSSKDQLVVFAMNRFPIDELRRRYPKHVRVIVGSGEGSTLTERSQNLKDFQEGKYQVLAMTYKAGSESLNIQNARVSLYSGYPWTDGILKQAIARTYRYGQKEKTLHYFLTSGHNDQRILAKVLAKEEATNTVVASLKKRISALDELI